MAEPKVRFKYIYPDDYNTPYCNGAWGGVTPKGEIVMNLFTERLPIPQEQIHPLLETGRLGDPEKDDDDHVTIIRYITGGAIMNLQSAKDLHEWLDKFITQIETASKPSQE